MFSQKRALSKIALSASPFKSVLGATYLGTFLKILPGVGLAASKEKGSEIAEKEIEVHITR